MKNAYIRFNNRKYIKLIEKIVVFIKKICGKVSVEKLSIKEVNDTYIILLPEYKHYNNFRKNKIMNQINKFLSLNNIHNLILDKNLEDLSEKLNNYNILTGKILMKNMILEIIEYIFNINKINTELENIYVFVNEYSKCNIKIIEKLCKKFKTVNIITDNLEYYKRLENTLYNSGILITVSNNRRKSARNAKYVINFDFENEKIEQYSINIDAIIINLTDEKVQFGRSFRGILINDFNVSFDEDNLYFIREFFGNVNKKVYLESTILDMNCDQIEKQVSSFNVKIDALIGVRGIIQEEEFECT